jgi:two-component system sensor histidine kinase TctE
VLDNAMKYTPAGGQVTLRVLDRDPAQLEVEDSGPGIPDADQERVFERFYRGMQTEVEGSGLGLAIVREVAEQHGGAVSIASAVGHSGTVVTVTLPRAVETG